MPKFLKTREPRSQSENPQSVRRFDPGRPNDDSCLEQAPEDRPRLHRWRIRALAVALAAIAVAMSCLLYTRRNRIERDLVDTFQRRQTSLAVTTPKSDIADSMAAYVMLTYGLVGGLAIVFLLSGYLVYWSGKERLRNRERRKCAAERKEYLEEIQKAHNHLQTVIDGIGELIMVTDSDYTIVLANRAVRELAGGVDPVADGMKCYEVFYARKTPCDDKNDPCPTLMVRASKKPVTVPHNHRDAKGEAHIVELTAWPVLDEAGDVVQIIKFGHDITVRKRAEKSLREANLELKDTNRQLEIAIDRANEMAKAAERANHFKSEFLANMSHEIRTPLTSILGFADLLADSEHCPADRQYWLHTIRRNGEHLLTLINRILDISKTDAGKTTLNPSRCNLPSLLEEVVSMMRVRARKHETALSVEYPTDLPETVLVDVDRLKQILLNVVGNAVKFTDKGQVRIVTTFIEDWRAEQPAIRIEVADSGIGIEPDKLQRLGEPFYQADISGSGKYGGTGLGLAITQNIIKLMGGELAIRSVLHEGSVFVVTFPCGPLDGVKMVSRLAEAEDESTMSETTQAVSDEALDEALKGRRILLAEDGTDSQRLISTILGKAGAEVELARDGRAAVELALKGTFDVILMDMRMPEMDGYQATKYLREKGFAGVIIALTAHALNEDRARCLAVGCTDYLTKPIDRAELIRTIARYCSAGSRDDNREPKSDSTHAADAAPTGVIKSDFADDSDLAELINQFVGGLAGQIESMRRSLSNGHHEELGRLAHNLKGAGGSYGYPSLTDAARELEKASKAGDSEAAALAMKMLETLAQAVIDGHNRSSVGAKEPSHANTDCRR